MDTCAYPAEWLGAHDGDTLTVLLALPLGVRKEETVRLVGVDAYELNTDKGKAALAFVKAWREAHPGPYTLTTTRDKREKYGRLLGTVTAADGACLNTDLVTAGHAVPYSGGKRVAP